MIYSSNNKEVFHSYSTERVVEICVIILTELSEDEVEEYKKMFAREKYPKWKQVMFLKNSSAAPQIEGKFVVMQSSGN